VSVVKTQVTICPYMNFAEGIVLTSFTTIESLQYNLKSSALSLFPVTANYLFSKYRLLTGLF